MSQEPQVLSVRKDAHGDLPNQTARQKTPTPHFIDQIHCEQFLGLRGSRGRIIRRARHIALKLI
jgi:hypothetical protein